MEGEGGGGGRTDFGIFWGKNKLSLVGKTLGFFLGVPLWFVLGRGKTLEEEADNGGEEGQRQICSLFPFSFFFLLMVLFTFPLMF